MKAFALHRSPAQPSGSTGVLVQVDLPVPQPQSGEVVVAVRASGVTPSELRWYPTTHNHDGSPRQDAVPGHEFSGEVVAIGQNVSHLRAGDPVFGMSDWFANGATAQFCVARQDSIIAKPGSLSHITAAATPISALTAWQGLVQHARVKRKDRVLIVGASGTVGLLAVQVARLHGCTVFGSAAASARSQLRSLGCQEVFDYHSQPFQQHLSNIDVVFDTVGGNTLACAEKILAPKGRMVTIAADSERNKDPLVKSAYFTVESSAALLQNIVGLIAESKLHPFVKAVLPLAEAPRAYSAEVHVPALGKLVLEAECAAAAA